jgi:ABC-2 type transport system permease protein
MSTIYILWLRELKRYSRSRVQMIASLGQPVLYLLALGFGFGPVFARAGNGSYLQFMAPGVVGMSILFMCVFSGISILWDRQFGFLKETLVAPVPRMQIMLGRTLGSATVATFQGILVFIICLAAGLRPHNWMLALPQAFVFMAMVAITFAALGTAFGSVIKDMQGFPIVMNFMVMPMFFLSGALYPLSHLPSVLTVITRLDPLTYGIDGLRGSLTGVWHFSFALDVAVMAFIAAAFLSLGAYFFSKIQI